MGKKANKKVPADGHQPAPLDQINDLDQLQLWEKTVCNVNAEKLQQRVLAESDRLVFAIYAAVENTKAGNKAACAHQVGIAVNALYKLLRLLAFFGCPTHARMILFEAVEGLTRSVNALANHTGGAR